MWNAVAFVEEMCEAFSDVTAVVRANNETYEERALDAARLGFARHWSLEDWGIEEITYFEDFVYPGGGYSEDSLSGYEEDAEAVAVFSLFVYGALVAKRGIGDIDPREFLLAEAILPGVTSLRMNDIRQSYTKR